MGTPDLFADFSDETHDVDGARLRVRRSGEGPPVLLLHGYPQTGAMWHAVAPRLTTTHAVVVPDLRGYGGSRVLDGDLTFRAMARDQAALMTALGHDRFDVVGHDRGARVAHRLALDSTDRVTSVALLDILPTLDVWSHMDAWLARRYFHWAFLAQPGGMPQRLLAAEPLAWLEHALGSLGGGDFWRDEAMAEYREAAGRRAVTDAWCGDYAAAAGPDLEHDRADLGRTLDLPSLVLWGERGVVGAQTDPLAAWRAWFPGARGAGLDASHFLAEERPADVVDALVAHLGRGPGGAGAHWRA